MRLPEDAALDISHDEERRADDAFIGAIEHRLGTGKPCAWSALMTRNSRSTACADGSSLPGGLRRST